MASVEPVQEGTIKGFLHTPAKANGSGLVITHGAGGNCGMALLVAVAEPFAAAGWSVLRCDLAFRQRGGTPHPSRAHEDRAVLREAVAWMRKRAKGPVVMGGQSYGGRQASMLAAEDPSVAQGLVLFSYPLHPPGKPAQMRTEHFPSLRTPTLFVEGDRDPFASQEEIREAVKLIPGRVEILPITKAGHDLNRGKWVSEDLVVRVAALCA